MMLSQQWLISAAPDTAISYCIGIILNLRSLI